MDPVKYSGIIRFIRNIYAMYSISYRYNLNTTNPYSVYKQRNPKIHNFYSDYKKKKYSFPYKFGFGRIIRIQYIPGHTMVNFRVERSCSKEILYWLMHLCTIYIFMLDLELQYIGLSVCWSVFQKLQRKNAKSLNLILANKIP